MYQYMAILELETLLEYKLFLKCISLQIFENKKQKKNVYLGLLGYSFGVYSPREGYISSYFDLYYNYLRYGVGALFGILLIF